MLTKIKRAFHEFNALREYKKFAPEINRLTQNLGPDQLIDFIFSDQWKRFFWMIQIPSEIRALLNKVASIKPKVVVEIGTRSGGTLFLFTKVAAESAQIVSIDFPDGHGGGYSNARYQFYKMFAVAPQQMNLIQADSHLASTRVALEKILSGRKIDYLFIDGDHSLEGVKMDFEMYGSLVRPGGLVAFHDIKDTKANSWSGVIPFWESIKRNYTYEEYNGEEDSWGGIGIITMP